MVFLSPTRKCNKLQCFFCPRLENVINYNGFFVTDSEMSQITIVFFVTDWKMTQIAMFFLSPILNSQSGVILLRCHVAFHRFSAGNTRTWTWRPVQGGAKGLPDHRVDELFEPLPFHRIGEHDVSQRLSVQLHLVGLCPMGGNGGSIPLQDGLAACTPRGQGVSGVAIGIQNREATVAQPAPHAAFAGCDAAGETDPALAWHGAAAGCLQCLA